MKSPSEKWGGWSLSLEEAETARQRYVESTRAPVETPRDSAVPLWLQPWLVIAWCVSVGLLVWCVIGGCR